MGLGRDGPFPSERESVKHECALKPQRRGAAGAPGFTVQALAFHHAADKITDAARYRDLRGVLGELGGTLAICTGCHAGFKQQVVAELAFDQSGAVTPSMVHGR